MTRYRYELWFDSQLLTEEDGFLDEEEAMEIAEDEIEFTIRDWKFDDAYNGETRDDFDVRIYEYEEKFE